MDMAKIFTHGRSQAVRLPKDYRFDADEVCVARLDDMVILFPRKRGWDVLARGIERFTDDFMTDRDQPAEHERRDDL